LIETIAPGEFDKKKLAPLYARINAAYQNASSTNIMWFEPAQVPDAFAGFVESVGFKTPPGGQVDSPNHVLNDHTYCCVLGADVCSGGEPAPGMEKKCLAWHEKKLGARTKDAERLGVPLIISEFGACLDS